MKPWEMDWSDPAKSPKKGDIIRVNQPSAPKKGDITSELKPWEKYQRLNNSQAPVMPAVNTSKLIEDTENMVVGKKAIEKTDYPDSLVYNQGIERNFADAAGLPVDIGTMAINAGSYLLNKIPGVNIPNIQNPVGGSDWIANKSSKVAPYLGIDVADYDKMNFDDKVKYNVARFGSGAGVGGLALASRANRAGQVAKEGASVFGKFKQAIVEPYKNNAGRQVADDVIAGAGAGAGYTVAEDIAPDSPLAQIVGTILGGGVTSVGSRVAESTARKTGRGIVKALPGKGMLPDSVRDKVEFYNERLPDNSVEKKQTVQDAALMIQKLSSDPKKARDRISQSIKDSDEAGMTRLTSGVAADDIGLGSFENYQRLQNSKPYMERDQTIRTDVSDSINNLKNPNADVELPQKLAKEKADNQLFSVSEQAKLVKSKLNQLDFDKTLIDRQVEDITEPFLSQRGKKSEASKALNDQIGQEGVLGERTKVKNDKYEEAAGDKVVDVTPIADSLKRVENEVNELGFENTGIPADFVKKIRAALPQEVITKNPFTGAETKEIIKNKEIKLKDLSRVRRDISSSINRARRAGNYDLADNLSTLKDDINKYVDKLPEFDDAQKYYREEYAPFFAEGYGKKFRDTVHKGEGIGASDPGKIADIFLNGTPDAAADLRRIVNIAPDEKSASSAVEKYMAADLASSIGSNSSPRTIANWIRNRSAQLDQFPEVKQKFSELQRKIGSKELEKDELNLRIKHLDEIFRQADSNIKTTKRRLDKGIFKTLIHNDPDKYIGEIMGAKDRLKKLDEVNKLIGKNEQAREGFKRAFTEDLINKIESADVKAVDNDKAPILYHKINKVMKENEDALAKVYSPEEMNALRRSQKMLSQYGNLNRRATVGSDNVQKQNKQQYMDAMETFFRVQYGVLKAGGIMRTIKGAANILPEGRVAKADRLVARAMLDPELAMHLLDSPASQIGTAKWNKRLTYLLAGEAGVRESVDGHGEEDQDK